MQKNSDNFSLQEAMQLARSETGQQLLALLQSQNGDALRQAMNQAATGDYDQVKQTMSALLDNPKARALLEELRRQQHG